MFRDFPVRRCLKTQSFERIQSGLFLESAEPGIGENVAWAIRRPAWWIHFAMRFYNRIVITNFAATLPEVTNQFLTRFQLGAAWLVAVEIADQTDSEGNIIEIITVDVAPVDLPPPSVTYFDLAISGRCSVANDKMVSEPILHTPHMSMIIIKHRCVSLPRPAIVHNNVLPARSCHRSAVDLGR